MGEAQEPKACKDCTFCKPNTLLRILSLGLGDQHMVYARCSHPSAERKGITDVVSGVRSDQPNLYCSTNRISLSGLCGREAKFFEPKT